MFYQFICLTIAKYHADFATPLKLMQAISDNQGNLRNLSLYSGHELMDINLIPTEWSSAPTSGQFSLLTKQDNSPIFKLALIAYVFYVE